MFDYLPPEGETGSFVGRRVLAPLRGREEVGVVMETARRSEVPKGKLLRVKKIFRDMPPLSRPALDLVRFCAQYYCCPIGVAAFAALPAPFRKNAELKIPSHPPTPTHSHPPVPPVPADSSHPSHPSDLSSPSLGVPPRLTAEQKAALSESDCGNGFAPHLIFGATGFRQDRDLFAACRAGD